MQLFVHSFDILRFDFRHLEEVELVEQSSFRGLNDKTQVTHTKFVGQLLMMLCDSLPLTLGSFEPSLTQSFEKAGLCDSNSFEMDGYRTHRSVKRLCKFPHICFGNVSFLNMKALAFELEPVTRHQKESGKLITKCLHTIASIMIAQCRLTEQ
ncbi:MAG: hypothetical protein APF78_08000 [Sphingomonadales bacterium BRH_c3]|nr:MAG: hypothetical protein APF78_08000 [Sphingomonadales bacterium BRH_c3]